MLYLLTTADERTWKFERPVLFLGEWCRRYERRHVWQRMESVVAAPYGRGSARIQADLDLVDAISEPLLNDLASALNSVHRVGASRRFWQIVLGHWLKRYVATALNRYRTVEQAITEHRVGGTTALDAHGYALCAKDSLGFLRACNTDAW